jgi:hypothetical protein
MIPMRLLFTSKKRPSWWIAGGAAALGLLLFAAAGMALDVKWIPAWGDGPAARAEPPEQPELDVRAVQRCRYCGWIESKRKVAASVLDPQSLATYEYTLRHADGSSSVFQETLPASWRVGERLTVINGAGTPPP